MIAGLCSTAIHEIVSWMDILCLRHSGCVHSLLRHGPRQQASVGWRFIFIASLFLRPYPPGSGSPIAGSRRIAVVRNNFFSSFEREQDRGFLDQSVESPSSFFSPALLPGSPVGSSSVKPWGEIEKRTWNVPSRRASSVPGNDIQRTLSPPCSLSLVVPEFQERLPIREFFFF